MKELLRSGVAILIGLLIAYIVFLRDCRGKDYYIPEDKVLIRKSTWDSIEKKLFVKDSLIYIHDSFEVKEPVYLVRDSFIYVEDSIGIKHYSDSLVNDSIRIWDNLYIQGIITKWERRYEPVIHTIKETITVTIPRIVEQPVYYTNNGIYVSVIMGGNSNTFALGGSLDYINKKNNLYGLQYQRIMDQNIYSVKMGFKIIGRHK